MMKLMAPINMELMLLEIDSLMASPIKSAVVGLARKTTAKKKVAIKAVADDPIVS